MKRLFLASAIVLVASSLSAGQNLQADARWRPWVGCWVPVGPEAITWDPNTRQVCVVPSAGISAIDIVSVANARIVSREHIEASGDHRKSERDGCTGWESAEWSPDTRRVYLQSEYECAGGVTRRSSGLIAMSLKGEWLNIVGVGVGENAGVRVLRHRRVGVSAALPSEVASALDGTGPLANAARTAAVVAPAGTGDIIEASHHLNAAVVEAWLNEIGQIFTIDAKRLVALADGGVPDRVIDMIVALSYPKAFSVKPSPTSLGSLATPARGDAGSGFDTIAGVNSVLDCGLYEYGFSTYGWDPCSTYGSALYGASRYGYSPYAYLSGGYGGWYLATQPTIVLVKPAEDTGSTHGQVINGRGYSEGGASGGSAVSGGGADAGSSSGGTSGAASAGGDRTAQPR